MKVLHRKKPEKSLKSRIQLCEDWEKKEKLQFKCKEYGTNIVIVDESYTSKTCTKCGNLHKTLGSNKTYNCKKCNMVIDRDVNGARNILNKTDFIILEIPLFGQYNEGVPTFLEHIKIMEEIGFVPYDIVDNNYINTFNMQIDMLFINKTHRFNKIVNEILL